MNVTINKMILIKNENFVEFSTVLGSAIAAWNAGTPKLGELYDVELEVMEEVVWGVNAHRALKDVYSIEVANGFINLTGRIMSIDADGVAAVDLDGSVVLLEVVGFTGDIPVFVDLEFKKITLFPTGV